MAGGTLDDVFYLWNTPSGEFARLVGLFFFFNDLHMDR